MTHIYIIGFSFLMGMAGMADHDGTFLQGGVAMLAWLALIYGCWGAHNLYRFIRATM